MALNKKPFNLKRVLFNLFSHPDTKKEHKVSASLKLAEDRFIELLGSPAVLFIDEAHDCDPRLLSYLERLTGNVWKANALFSVVLLSADRSLKRSTAE